MSEVIPSNPIALIYDDPRRILELIRFVDGRNWCVGANCHTIIAYKESGENSYVPFYAIYNYGGDIIARVPALHVEVRYGQ